MNEEVTTSKPQPKAEKIVKVQVLKKLYYKSRRYSPKITLVNKTDPNTSTGFAEEDTIIDMEESAVKSFGPRYVKEVTSGKKLVHKGKKKK